MKPPIETVRLSDRSKDLLIKIKRASGIPTWNVICRLAFCLSLRDKSPPPPATEGQKPAIEISWKVFGGELADIYGGLLKQRYNKDDLSALNISIEECLKRHIFRGLGSLDAATSAKNQGSLAGLFQTNIRNVS